MKHSEVKSQQVGEDEARRLGLYTVNPEISAARVVLVAAVRQFEIVRLGVKSLSAASESAGEREETERLV